MRRLWCWLFWHKLPVWIRYDHEHHPEYGYDVECERCFGRVVREATWTHADDGPSASGASS